MIDGNSTPKSGKPAMTLRERAGLSQRKVSVMLNVRPGTISDWERGKSIPHLPANRFFKMVHAYKTSVDEIVDAFEDNEEDPLPPLPPRGYKKLMAKGLTEEDIIDVFGETEEG